MYVGSVDIVGIVGDGYLFCSSQGEGLPPGGGIWHDKRSSRLIRCRKASAASGSPWLRKPSRGLPTRCFKPFQQLVGIGMRRKPVDGMHS